ncbi:MAG: hypothetical protein ACP5T0_09900 [Verrucomicrobiia bacterium]
MKVKTAVGSLKEPARKKVGASEKDPPGRQGCRSPPQGETHGRSQIW